MLGSSVDCAPPAREPQSKDTRRPKLHNDIIGVVDGTNRPVHHIAGLETPDEWQKEGALPLHPPGRVSFPNRDGMRRVLRTLALVQVFEILSRE